MSLIVFLAALVLPSAQDFATVLEESAFIAAIFLSIALHELGHALAALRYQIKTRDITLYPFGGIASITSIPHARAELVIALAGPLVNVVIALLLCLIVDINDILRGNILGRLLVANIFLTVFNMIPAIPMDGGRVLRSLLVMAGFERASLYAARLSQCIALIMGIVAILYARIDLMLVAVVVFIGAMQERFQQQFKSNSRGRLVKHAMVPRDNLQFFTSATTVRDALNVTLQTLQDAFPVLQAGRLKGVVSKDNLLRFASVQLENAYLHEIVDIDVARVSPDEVLADAFERSLGHEMYEYALVVDKQDNVLGMLFREKVIELLLIDELQKRIEGGDLVDTPPLH